MVNKKMSQHKYNKWVKTFYKNARKKREPYVKFSDFIYHCNFLHIKNSSVLSTISLLLKFIKDLLYLYFKDSCICFFEIRKIYFCMIKKSKKYSFLLIFDR